MRIENIGKWRNHCGSNYEICGQHFKNIFQCNFYRTLLHLILLTARRFESGTDFYIGYCRYHLRYNYVQQSLSIASAQLTFLIFIFLFPLLLCFIIELICCNKFNLESKNLNHYIMFCNPYQYLLKRALGLSLLFTFLHKLLIEFYKGGQTNSVDRDKWHAH